MTDHVIQHHEGGGKPSDGSLAFIGTKGYSYGIGGSVKPNGATYWQRFRSPSQDFSTAGANHTTMGVCLSGDRDTYPVTAADLLAMREIAADARARGDLTPAPYVTPHREMPPPNNTICPGNQVAFVHPPKFPAGNNLVWVAVVAAYHEEQVPMPPKVTPEFFPPIGISALAVFTHPTRGRCAVAATPDGHIYCDPP
ncbi:MAG TPA: N-acetylmuramoyl-L-alanine amidase, partial [Gemmatimonadaceae bacterium]|nr:N-acetylmuramoyl-L-alanine amidase [Gemmatimonadaceae bacterium]